MGTIFQNLHLELKKYLSNADEIWIAVALMTESGMDLIQKNLPDTARQHYVLGIDLPTSPKVLETLNDQQILDDVTIKMYIDREFYHPKVYIIRSNDTLTAFVGSANCTQNGLYSNVELSIKTIDQKECKSLLNWFLELEKNSIQLNKKFITEYKLTYKVRKERQKNEENETQQAKKKLNQEYEITLEGRYELIKMLKLARRKKQYEEIKKNREKDVYDIRASLDYPRFKNVDIEAFFNIWELGHLIAIPKPTIHREISKFRKLLKVLTDDSIDIAVRIDRALKGDLYIRGIGEALITKVLTVHNPEKYFVKNDKTESALQLYGIDIPKRISKGEKYKAMNKFLKKLCEETGIENFAILDQYLYNEALKLKIDQFKPE